MQSAPILDLMKRAALPAACLLIILYFGMHALFGPSGYLALDDIRQEKAELAQRQAMLMQKKAALSRDIALLDPRGADPDFADELVRRHLGVIRPDEVIVPFERDAVPPRPQAAPRG
ncbi:FtsB family cell division protein [Sandaracinobacteroides hominis]|uniref:FtsB family cell division protein n=1 Tax=Sandaracinobacteroides hominis TaxID=2780086 RepID=UPI0018F2F3A6|nr:septum formation initiator family protein [Sandaracinobacteroides hominis]